MHRDEMLGWLREDDGGRLEQLWLSADAARREAIGDGVRLGGILEISSFCRRNCAYCGLREDNPSLTRYRMTFDAVLEGAEEARDRGYHALVIESGEYAMASGEWIGAIVRAIREATPLAITLSLGERGVERCGFWRACGAERYLLRFETSDRELYQRLHPPLTCEAPGRIELLREQAGLGYQIGSGIMVGLPGQTWSSVADDLELFRGLGLGLIDIGLYVPNPDTPLGRGFLSEPPDSTDQVPNTGIAALKVMALARILCPLAEIPAIASSCRPSIDGCGIEEGLRAGANMVTIDVTPIEYRRCYVVHPGYRSPDDDGGHERALGAIAVTGHYVASADGTGR